MPKRLGPTVMLLFLATGFSVAWHRGLWLIVCAMAATGAALAVRERVADRMRAQRVAVWALHAPTVPVEAHVLEHLFAADLAATAAGYPGLLEDSAAQAEETITDPWLRSLASERLDRARTIASSEGVVTTAAPLLDMLASRIGRVVLASGAGAGLVAGLLARHRGVLVLVTACVAAVGIGQAESQRREDLRTLLCDQAGLPALQGLVVVPENALVAAIAAIAGSSPRVVPRAKSLMASASITQREVALRRLACVEQSATRRRGLTVTSSVVVWGATATFLTVIMAAM